MFNPQNIVASYATTAGAVLTLTFRMVFCGFTRVSCVYSVALA